MEISRLWIACLAISFQFVLSVQIGAADKPNVVVLFSDDAGYADFGFQPSCPDDMKNLTPHIDRIAHQGVRCSNAYMVGCVCSPSRAGLMTGRYQQRFGFENNLPPGHQNGLDLKETFGAKRLKKFGYETGLVGKWHLGYPDAFHPNERGFDWFFGCLQGSRPYYPIKRNLSSNRVLMENRKPTPESGYVTDRLGDAAVRFIEANKANPFYLFVSFTAPHGPLQPKESDANRWKHITNKKRANYAGLIVALDDNVGKILDCLEKNGLSEKTLVIFTNDNGGQTRNSALNTPLSGAKGSLLEGGIRVPWAMRWPGKIKAGSEIVDPITSLDLLPTMVELCGDKAPPQWKLDGVSLADLMVGKVEQLPERDLFWRTGGSKGTRAMRRGNWKLLQSKSGRDTSPRLYDLKNDVGETDDLAPKNPEIVQQLTARLDEWEKELIEPLWKMEKKRSGKRNDGSGSRKGNRSEADGKQERKRARAGGGTD